MPAVVRPTRIVVVPLVALARATLDFMTLLAAMIIEAVPLCDITSCDPLLVFAGGVIFNIPGLSAVGVMVVL